MSDDPCLVLGASGGFGGAVARELLGRGRRVRALVRNREKAERVLAPEDGLQLVEGNAENPDTVAGAATGCCVIVDGINLPFHHWLPRLRTVTDNVAAAARLSGATILFPGNVFGFGAQAGRPLPESAEMAPTARKGELRVELETALRQSAERGETRTIVLRAGDYFGPTVRNGLVNPIFAAAAKAKTMRLVGSPDVAHQWAYVPDLARLAVELIDAADRLAPFEIVHFTGHVAERQSEFLRLVAVRAGHPELAITSIPWWLFRVAGVFDKSIQEVLELRYLWDTAVILDDTRRRALFPGFLETPIEKAIDTTIDSYRAGS